VDERYVSYVQTCWKLGITLISTHHSHVSYNFRLPSRP